MPILSIPTGDIYYEVHGEGPAIMLAHGMGGNHASWYQQVQVLAQSYKVISFDHRGFGNSTDPQGLGRSAFVGDMKAILDHLDIDRVALIGQSMGGGSCICFAGKYPQRVSALIIADSLHAITEGGQVADIMSSARAETSSMTQLERVLGRNFRESEPEKTLLYKQINSFNVVDRHSMTGHYEATYTPQQLSALGVPILFIAGTDDILFPIEAIRLVQQQVENSFLVEVCDVGHSAFFESPTEFNDSVLSVLEMAGVKGVKRAAHSNTQGYQRLI
ncbi:MAG: alpha/beta hydrolase [Pseudomonadales bacterium]